TSRRRGAALLAAASAGLAGWPRSGKSDDGWAVPVRPLLTSKRSPPLRGDTVRYWKSSAGAVVAVLAVVAAPVGAAEANLALAQVRRHRLANSTSQHATEVEPDTFAAGSTVMGAFQVGRFFSGGATDIGFARSGNGGKTWGPPGFLPGMTFSAGDASPFERVSDPSVAYDAAHATWLISSIPLLPNTSVPTVFVNRSTDDGQTWSTPIR